MSLGGSVADDTGGFSEVGFVGDDFDTASLGDGDLASEASEVKAYGCHDLLLVHNLYRRVNDLKLK